MARKKIIKTAEEKVSDAAKIAEFIKNNGVKVIEQNVSGGFEPKSFFQRRKKIAGKKTTKKA